jgi:TP901 family phage tail tape measure protein
LNEVEIVIKGTDKSGPALSSATAGARKAATEMAAAQDRVAKAQRTTAESARAAERAQLGLSSAELRVERDTAAATAAQERYGAGSLQAREAAARLAKAQFELGEAEGRVTESSARAGAAMAAERDAAAGLAETQRVAAAEARGLGRAEVEAGGAAKVAATETGSVSRAQRGMSESTGALTGLMSKFATVAKVGMVGGLIAVGVAAASTLKIGIDYQQQLNMMQAVTHSTGAEMQQVAKKARDLGNDLSLPATSAGDAAQAMTELAKGNLTAKQAMDAAKGTLQLAAAAQITGAEAAKIQADALGAFSLKATAASHVADVLANAANSATGEISDFAQGLAASSAVAHQFGLSVDDTVTGLALFANAGIHGSDAGTSLKSALLALASPSTQAAAALKVLHLNAFDAHGRFVGLESISQQLATAQGRLSQQTFAAATSTAFGSDAARAAGVLASAGAVGWEKMAAGISKSGGAAAAAQAQMKGVGGALAGIKSELETIQIDVFTAAAPGVERFLHWVAGEIPKAIAALGAGFHAAGQPVNDFVRGFRDVELAMAPIGQLLPGLNAGLKPLKDAVAGMGAAGDGMAKGMAPVRAALAGVGAAGKGAADVFTSMGPMIGETGKLMGDAVKPIGPLLKGAGSDASKSGLETFFYNVGKGIANMILFVRRNADTWKDWGSKVADAARTAAGIIKGIIGFGHDLAKYKGWLEPIAGGLAAAVIAFKAWALATRIATAAMIAFDLAADANPVGAIVLAVVALTAAFVIAWRRSETFRDVMSKVFLVLVPIVLGLVSPILGVAAAITIAWKKSETFRTVVTSAFKGAASAVLSMARFIVDAVLGMVIGVLHAAGKMPGPLGAPFRAAERSVKEFKATLDRQLAAAQGRIDAFGRKPARKDITVRVLDRATGVLQARCAVRVRRGMPTAGSSARPAAGRAAA